MAPPLLPSAARTPELLELADWLLAHQVSEDVVAEIGLPELLSLDAAPGFVGQARPGNNQSGGKRKHARTNRQPLVTNRLGGGCLGCSAHQAHLPLGPVPSASSGPWG